MSMPKVELDAFQREAHGSLVARWLNQPHVIRWWGDPESNRTELRERREDAQAIITLDGQPVGYLCWQSPSPSELEAAGLTDLPRDLIDVDIMIGEPHALGRGVGPEALRRLFARLRATGASVVGVATAVANQRASSAYVQAGLRPFRDFLEQGERYRYFTKRLLETARPGGSAAAAMRRG